MSFKQLKTLLWRNIILKKRGRFFTILEIIIPIIIIGIIGNDNNFTIFFIFKFNILFFKYTILIFL